MPKQASDYLYSVVIPVFNSEAILEKTIERTVNFFEQQGWRYEIIFVNDGSSDDSWQILEHAAAANPHIIAIDLLRNYGQHTAIYAGFHATSGDYIITIDDDLQNPPEEIVHVVDKILEGYDVVYGQFRQKKHSFVRRLGSRLVQTMNERIFHQPKDLIVTNFRIMHRDVVERICNYRTPFPYITGMSLMFSRKRASVMVEHHPRSVGKSNYNIYRILALVLRLLFSYSTFPLRFVSTLGFIATIVAFIVGLYFLLRAVFIGTSVPGWASTIVLLSFFGGINIVIVSMLGEYVQRLVQQSSDQNIYHIREKVQHDE